MAKVVEVNTVMVESSVDSDGSTVGRSSKGGVREATLYHWKYRHYFEVIEEGDKNLRARCTLYSASAKPLSEIRRPILKKHLETVHKTVNLVAILPEAIAGTKHQRSAGDSEDNDSKKQRTLDRRVVSSQEVRKVVTEYIIEEMLPLSTVESPALLTRSCAITQPEGLKFIPGTGI